MSGQNGEGTGSGRIRGAHNTPELFIILQYTKEARHLPKKRMKTSSSSSVNQNNVKNQKVKIQLKRTGSLAMFGYALKDAEASTRREALKGAVARWGSSYVIKKITVLGIYNKNRHPEYAKRAADDVAWVQRLRNGMTPSNRDANLKTTRRRIAAGEPNDSIGRRLNASPASRSR